MMNKKLLTLTFAALTAGLLGSCTKINEEVVNLNKDINEVAGKVNAQEQMIQTVTIVQAYDDGSVRAEDGIVRAEDGIVTINRAKQMFIDGERGSIKVGKYADFLLVDKDVLSCDAIQIQK